MTARLFFTITGQDFRESIARSRRERNDVAAQIRAIEQKTFAGRLPQARSGVTASREGAAPQFLSVAGSAVPSEERSHSRAEAGDGALISDTTPSAHSVTKANERNVSACENGDVNAREVGRIL